MPKKSLKKSVNKQGYLSQINWGESYTSLFLGAVVVVVALILLFSFLKTKNVMNKQAQSTSTTQEQMVNARPTTYTVKEGDSLWTIAEILYKSGYNWVDLAKANNLENPGVIDAGTKLLVPSVEPKQVTVAEVVNQTPISITGSTYTVVKGDYLWNIALRAYGDGYKWVEIANANHLVNPNLIHSGNVLILPR